MKEKIYIAFQKIKDKLWFRPVIFCILSILGALLAQVADRTPLHELVPDIKTESITELLNIISSSMLVIATFTVGSMISAFAAASNTATPRSFNLIIQDDVSRNSLSAFIGSFIFSIVALVALKNGYYGKAGLFTLFILTMILFTIVILTFLRWVERISRLGRMGHTIKLIEDATYHSLCKRIKAPTLQGIKINDSMAKGAAVYGEQIGYIASINMEGLQEIAQRLGTIFILNAIPGKFVSLDLPLLHIDSNYTQPINSSTQQDITSCFTISDSRYFEDDPRFGLITLSEIASRALSPAINDPGTAIQIISSHVRLFSLYNQKPMEEEYKEEKYNKIAVPQLAIADLYDDAFRPIARDGAATIEVMIRLQKALKTISKISHAEMYVCAYEHSLQSFLRAEKVMTHPTDLAVLKNESLFIQH